MLQSCLSGSSSSGARKLARMDLEEALDVLGGLLERVPEGRQLEAVNACVKVLQGFADLPELNEWRGRQGTIDSIIDDLS